MKFIRAESWSAVILAAFFLWGCVEGNPDGDGERGFDLEEEECIPGVDERCPLDCQDLESWPVGWLEKSTGVVQKTNDRRMEGESCDGEEMPPVQRLEINPALEQAARCHSLDMARRDVLTHDGGDGSDEIERALRAGYPSEYVGENVAAGQTSPRRVVEAWVESGSHCINLMHEHYEEMGVAVVQLEGRKYWTQVFGAPH